jgi:putative endonuclease
MFYVYILQSKINHSLYTGYTADLLKRFNQHNSGESKYTKNLKPWKLIYYEAYILEEDAVKRECFLKSGSGKNYLDKQLDCYFKKFPRIKKQQN